MLGRIWDVCTGCFQAFFTLPAGLYLRWVCPGVLFGTAENGSLIYYFSITANEDSQGVLNVLDQRLIRAFRESGTVPLVSAKDEISFRAEKYPGACARLNISEQGWQFSVPSNFLSGESYSDMEAQWNNIAMEMYRVLAARYA